MTRQILILLTALMSRQAFGMQAFTLQTAIESGMSNSPAIQKAEAKKEEGKWKGFEGTAVFLPSISANASHFFEKKFQLFDLPFDGQTVEFPEIYPTSSATIDAKWLIFDGFQNIATYQGSQSYKASTEANYHWVSFQAAHEITLAYEKVVSSKKLEDVAEENLKTLQNHLDQVKKLQNGGLATNYDVLRVEALLSEADADLLQAKDNTLIAQENLGRELGISDSADATDTELAIPQPEKIKDLTYNRDTNKRQDLQSLENQVSATDSLAVGMSRFWSPKIYVTGEFAQYNDLTDSLSDWNRYRSAWSIGVALTWDLFNPQAIAQSQEEHYKAVQVEKSLVEANLQAPVDFAFWKKRYLYSATLYQAKKVDLDRANETVRLAQAGFKAGVRTTTEVLDAELDLFRARAGIVTAQMNCIEAKEKLELSLGETL